MTLIFSVYIFDSGTFDFDDLELFMIYIFWCPGHLNLYISVMSAWEKKSALTFFVFYLESCMDRNIKSLRYNFNKRRFPVFFDSFFS